MKKISAIIVVKDHPPHLQETLRSIDGLADEIIIGNINLSPEQITALRKNPKIKIHPIPSQTPFADMVKEDLKQLAKNDCVLYLDPDEIFPAKTLTFLQENLDRYDCFLFPRRNIIFGKWIEYSRWWPDYQVRLYKKNAVVWPKVIHPIPEIRGKQYKFEPKEEYCIIHYNYENLDQYLEKAIRYAKYEAQELVKSKQNLHLSVTISKALSEFISRYFANDGYKDGMHGLVLAALQMFYYFLIHFYYWEEKKYKIDPNENLNISPQLFFKKGLIESNHWLIKKGLISSRKFVTSLVNKVLKFLS